MKVRSDSPFAKLSAEEQEIILDMSEKKRSMSDLAEEVEHCFGIEACTEQALKRFLRRLRTEKAIEEAEEADEAMEGLALRSKDSRAREAALEAARQKLCALAVHSESPEELSATIKTLSEEKAREHELLMRERQIAVTEEQMKLGWRRLELDAARTAMKLLPRAIQILSDESLDDGRKVAEARRCLLAAPAVAGLVEAAETREIEQKDTTETKERTGGGATPMDGR